jgi:surfactin synthase thioesterase subunit
MNRWISNANLAKDARPNLFCFPYAGGGASFYRAWAPFAPRSIAICPVQLPGREERFKERPLDRMKDLVDAAADALIPFLGHPYALFGHSMGAIICYELAQELLERGVNPPMHLFASGASAPHVARSIPPIYHLPEDRLIEEIASYGVLPKEVMQSRELLDLLVPRFRADFAVTGTYAYADRPPLSFPITAFGGVDDHVVTPAKVEAWREHTVSRFRCELFPGGHFFLTELGSRVLGEVAAAIA